MDSRRARLRGALFDELARPAPRAPAKHLKRLVDALERPSSAELDRAVYSEAAIAVRLLANEARFDLEVPTAGGHTADIRLDLDGRPAHLHVKRWSPDDTDRGGATLVVPKAVRRLERVARPFLVGVRWPSSPRTLKAFLHDATRFLEQASVGDEFVYRTAPDAAPVGGVRVLAPWPGSRVVLTVGIDAAFADEARRLQRLFRKACGQFMPGTPNVIVLCGGRDDDTGEDVRTVDQALLGTHIERWDLFPPRGHRVAHGRADDGFWSRGRYNQSRLLVWLPEVDATGEPFGAPKVWCREDRADDLARAAALRALLAPPATS